MQGGRGDLRNRFLIHEFLCYMQIILFIFRRRNLHFFLTGITPLHLPFAMTSLSNT
jgi:hypothetical protein